MSRKKNNLEIVLASGSTYRRALLARLNQPFTVCTPDVDESPRENEPGMDLALRLAESKARAAATTHPRALIIGSDQVAVLDGRLLGKPGSFEKARAQLQCASGNKACFHTAVCLLNSESGKMQKALVPCTVAFRKLSLEMIEGYLRQEQPYDCAGAFKSEGLGIALLESMDTEDPTALIGLPLIRLSHMLAREGVDVLAGGNTTAVPP